MESHPFTTAWEVAQELNLDHSMAVWHWKQTGKVKKFDKWVPHELSENQKYHHFEVPSFLILHNSNETLLDQILTCAKSGFYTTTSDNQLSGHTEKKFPSTSQSQACTKKMSRSLFGGLWPNSSTTAFWILAKPLHLRTSEKYAQRMDEMHQKLHLQPAPVNRKGPVLCDNSWLHVTKPKLQKLNTSKAEWTGYEVLPYLPYSPDFLPTDCHFFKHLDNFLQ